MANPDPEKTRSRHLRITAPSPWVARFAPLVPKGGPTKGAILDLAAGGGRHGRYFHALGHPITAIDRDVSSLADFADEDGVTVIETDLEEGTNAKDVLSRRTFAGIVVINYLHRPLMDVLVGALEPGGVLIYETFARGNEDFVRPRNPDHLLKSGELLELARGKLQVVAYEHGIIKAADIEGVKQRLCAVNNLGLSTRDDGDPAPHPVPDPA
ncbi:MAG: SAM-dependent methyltransferase [Rhodospirillales bacterium]|nr:SAM-dependent methyltransferase [Alphaproteobacteria bacterium]MBL6948826.1 SAM-dependent methyltransferase [Rhodospirillales bacterium]